jgi:epoxyqueuosine reductase
MKIIIEELYSKFENLHAKFKTVSITHLTDLQNELMTWQHDGLITKKFYDENYGQFLFEPPETLQNARSIIIIGVPQKNTIVEFFYKNRRYHTVIPSTYIYTKIRAECKKILSSVLRKNGYSVDRAILPMKLLAVRSGLGKYGKNNLCYVEGMGSFTRLEAFYTGYEFSTDDWCDKELMNTCITCSLCQQACPTHCIPKDRVLLHADHCLTYLNENEEEFPSWVTKQSHNALVGCLHCQIVCPHNTKHLKYDSKTLTFTEEEIMLILHNTPKEQIPQTLAKKLKEFDIDEYYSLLPRNFSVLIEE